MAVSYRLCAALLSLLVLISGVPLIQGEDRAPDTATPPPPSSAPSAAEADMSYYTNDYDYEEDIVEDGMKNQPYFTMFHSFHKINNSAY